MPFIELFRFLVNYVKILLSNIDLTAAKYIMGPMNIGNGLYVRKRLFHKGYEVYSIYDKTMDFVSIFIAYDKETCERILKERYGMSKTFKL